MKKLLLFIFVIAINNSIAKAQCPPGALAYHVLNPGCPTGCSVLLIGWPEGALVNIYGGSPLGVVTSITIPGTLGGGGTGDAYTCVPCNTTLIYATAIPNATSGCVIITLGIVPVKITSFTAKTTTHKTSLLNWTVAEDAGKIKYTIQRSNDGRSFEDVETMDAYSNGSITNSYSYEDKTPKEGNNFYRIKITEITGKVTYSETALTKNDANFGFSVYPNPVTENFTISISEKSLPATVQLFNAQGQAVFKATTTQSTFKVDKSLKSGMYILRVTSSSNFSKTERIIKK